MARLLDLAHEVAYSLVVGHLEVEVRFHTTAVNVCRHRVPHATRSKFGHTHLQLAGRQHLINEHLVDVAFVAHLEATHVRYHGIRLGDLLVRIGAVSGSGVEVEQCGMRCIQALKTHLTVTATEIEGLLVVELEGVVTGNDATFAAYVEDTYLTAGKEERSLERIDGFKQQALAGRHSATDNHAVVHGVNHVYLVGCKHALDEEIMAKTGCVVRLGIHRVGGVTYFVVCFHCMLNC